MDARGLRLYLVADPDLIYGELVDVVIAAIGGGVTCVQLRVKSLNDREFEQLGTRVSAVCQERGVLFLVNDRVDIAMAAGADGVHLGVDDLSIEAARRLGGDEFVIGYSPESDEQAVEAGARGASYLGVGPVFGTTSKNDAGAAIGLEALQRRARLSHVPTVGIGGITASNAGRVLATGAVGVAVMSAILRAADPSRAAEELNAALNPRGG